MSSEQISEILVRIWPWVLSGTFTILSGIGSLLIWCVRRGYASHTKWQKHITTSLTALDESFKKEKDQTKDAILALRAELHLSKSDFKHATQAMLNLEGATKQQQQTINDYVEKMGVAHGQLQAVFRFLDAKPRSTDI